MRKLTSRMGLRDVLSVLRRCSDVSSECVGWADAELALARSERAGVGPAMRADAVVRGAVATLRAAVVTVEASVAELEEARAGQGCPGGDDAS